jgi:hypothetical protein
VGTRTTTNKLAATGEETMERMKAEERGEGRKQCEQRRSAMEQRKGKRTLERRKGKAEAEAEAEQRSFPRSLTLGSGWSGG